MDRRTLLPSLLALPCLCLAACSEDPTGTPSDDAPQTAASAPIDAARTGPTQVRWTIATNDGPDTPTGEAIARLTVLLHETSGGTMLLVPAWEAAGNPDDWDQAVARTVIRGDHQLGFVPARAFDALDVSSLQALQTPFLLTSTKRVGVVVESPVVDELMEGLDDIGLTGLALYPEDVRRLFSYGDPLTTPALMSDAVVRAPYSRMTDAVLARVGATTTDVQSHAWDAAVASGELSGVESSFAGVLSTGTAARLTTAANQPLFPKVNVLFVNREDFEGLEEDHRKALRRAAFQLQKEARDWPDESEDARAFCAAGGRVIEATVDDVRALRGALVAVDPPADPDSTRRLADEIAELVVDLPRTYGVGTC